MCAWSNSWEKALLDSEPYLRAFLSIGLWFTLAGLLYQCYRLAEKEIGKVQATSLAVQTLKEELVVLKGCLQDSVDTLSDHVSRTIQATAAGIEHMTVIQKEGIQRLKQELVAGPLAQEVSQVKTSTTDSLQSLRASLLFLEQRYEELQEVLPPPTETKEMADDLKTVKDEMRDIRKVVTLLAPALEKVMAWVKRGHMHHPLGGSTSWALTTEPKW
jgi:hypothetical protein